VFCGVTGAVVVNIICCRFCVYVILYIAGFSDNCGV
jgi:hypothetical protein